MEESKPIHITRRNFIKTSAAVGVGTVVSAVHLTRTFGAQHKKERYVIVGTGGRSRMYQDALQRDYQDSCELVGLCDVNHGRLQLARNRSRSNNAVEPPAYDAADFDTMIVETNPDRVIVTTVDGFHHWYIIRAMELEKDVITEKPLTIDKKKCQDIIDTQRKTGRVCTVTFNYRYSPPRTQVKDLLMSGVIGEVLSVDFHWMLNTHHGADYFRRWHSQKRLSGGLMVHKASHHFDLVNWWLSAIPVAVSATGKREFYTPEMAGRFGLESFHERCHTCPEKARCGFELSLENDRNLKELYLDNEQYDGYFRDRCVFRPGIDIEDTMNVLVKYDNNVTLCYSVNAFTSWEGYFIVFNGTKGRLEHKVEESIYVSGTDAVQGGLKEGGTTTTILPLRDPGYSVDIWTGEGGHGGGDALLLENLFSPEKKIDKYKRAADYRSGAYAMLIGAAANICFGTTRELKIGDLVRGIGYPDYTEMPSRTAPLPMPKGV